MQHLIIAMTWSMPDPLTTTPCHTHTPASSNCKTYPPTDLFLADPSTVSFLFTSVFVCTLISRSCRLPVLQHREQARDHPPPPAQSPGASQRLRAQASLLSAIVAARVPLAYHCARGCRRWWLDGSLSSWINYLLGGLSQLGR